MQAPGLQPHRLQDYRHAGSRTAATQTPGLQPRRRQDYSHASSKTTATQAPGLQDIMTFAGCPAVPAGPDQCLAPPLLQRQVLPQVPRLEQAAQARTQADVRW